MDFFLWQVGKNTDKVYIYLSFIKMSKKKKHDIFIIILFYTLYFGNIESYHRFQFIRERERRADQSYTRVSEQIGDFDEKGALS